MLLGNVPSTVDPTYQEVALSYGTGTIQPNTSQSFTVAAITMPFAGSMSVKAMASVNWGPGFQYVSFTLFNSTPGNGGNMSTDCNQDNKGSACARTLPAMAIW